MLVYFNKIAESSTLWKPLIQTKDWHNT